MSVVLWPFPPRGLPCHLPQVVGVLSAVLKSAEPPADLDQFALSKQTVLRERRVNRRRVGEQIKES